MNSLDLMKKMKAEVLKTYTKQHREIVVNNVCPVFGSSMEWNKKWEAFICEKHGKKAIYEIVSKK